MSQIALSLFKKHVYSDEYTEDDTLLQHYLNSAEEFAVGYTRRTSSELMEMGGGSSYPLPFVQAVLMLAGDWYNQREDTSTATLRPVPNGFRALVMPYRKLYQQTEES